MRNLFLIIFMFFLCVSPSFSQMGPPPGLNQSQVELFYSIPGGAEKVGTDTTNFNHNLTTSETTIQKALDKVDNLIINDPNVFVEQDGKIDIDTSEAGLAKFSLTELYFTASNFIAQGGTILDTSTVGLLKIFTLGTTEVEAVVDGIADIIYDDSFVNTDSATWDTSESGIVKVTTFGIGDIIDTSYLVWDTSEVDSIIVSLAPAFYEQHKNELAYQIIDSTTDIKGLWLMGGSGTILDDEFSTGHDGTLTGGLSMTTDRSYKGFCYSLLFDGTDDYIDLGDHDDFSFVDVGGNDVDFSICLVLNIRDNAVSTQILSKYNNKTGFVDREYLLQQNPDETISLFLVDESVGISCNRVTVDALSVGWHFIIVTYQGSVSSGNDAANFIKFYVDGLLVSSNATNSSTYVNMDNGGSSLLFGSYINALGDYDEFFISYMSLVAFEKSELSAATIYKMWKAVEAKYGL